MSNCSTECSNQREWHDERYVQRNTRWNIHSTQQEMEMTLKKKRKKHHTKQWHLSLDPQHTTNVNKKTHTQRSHGNTIFTRLVGNEHWRKVLASTTLQIITWRPGRPRSLRTIKPHLSESESVGIQFPSPTETIAGQALRCVGLWPKLVAPLLWPRPRVCWWHLPQSWTTRTNDTSRRETTNINNQLSPWVQPINVEQTKNKHRTNEEHNFKCPRNVCPNVQIAMLRARRTLDATT